MVIGLLLISLICMWVLNMLVFMCVFNWCSVVVNVVIRGCVIVFGVVVF